MILLGHHPPLPLPHGHFIASPCMTPRKEAKMEMVSGNSIRKLNRETEKWHKTIS